MGNEGGQEGLAGATRKSPQILELEEKKREQKLNSKATLSENCSLKKKHHWEEHQAPPCKRSHMKKRIDDLIFSFVAENPSDQDGEQYPSYGETAMKNDQHSSISSEQCKPEIPVLESQSLMTRRGPELLGQVKRRSTRVGRPPKIGPSPLGPIRDVGNWNRLSSGKEPSVPAVYNAPKTLEANKDENSGFKESRLHYIKDLGPKAQVAASKKLIKCASQAPSSSQTPSIHTKQTERPPVLHVTPGLQRPPHPNGSSSCAQIPTTTPHNLPSRSNFSLSSNPFGILGQACAEANARVSGGIKIQEPSDCGQEMNSLSIDIDDEDIFGSCLAKSFTELLFGSYDDSQVTVTSQNQTPSIPTKQTERPPVLHVTPGLQRPPHLDGSAYRAQIPTTPHNLPSRSNFSPSNNPFGILGQAFAEANARISGGVKIQEPSDRGQEMNSLSIENVNALNPSKEGMHQFSYLLGRKYNAAKGIDSGKNALKGRIVAKTDIDYEDIFGSYPTRNDDFPKTVTSQNQTPSIPTKQTERPPVLHVTPSLQRPPHLNGSAYCAQIPTTSPHNLPSRSNFSLSNNPFGILGQACAEANAHVSGGIKIQEPSDCGQEMNKSIDIDYEDIFGSCPANSFAELLLGNYDDSQVTVTSQNQTPSVPTKQTERPPVLHVTPGLQRPPHLDGSAYRAQIPTATPLNLPSSSKFSPLINPFGILGQAFAEANAHVSGGVEIQEPSVRGQMMNSLSIENVNALNPFKEGIHQETGASAAQGFGDDSVQPDDLGLQLTLAQRYFY